MNPRDRIDDRLIAELLPIVKRQREKAALGRAAWERKHHQKIPEDPHAPKEAELEAFLRSQLKFAVQWYEAEPWAEGQADAMTLHEIAGPIDVLLAALQNSANDGEVYMVLGGGDLFKGVRRRDALVGYLARLKASAAHHKPRKAPSYRPPNVNLRRLVGTLASTWVGATGWTFGGDWHGGEPVSPAAQFAHAVVKAVDPAALPQLKTATRWVAHARKRKKVPGYFNDVARKDAI
jgi:hypothetical protein